MTRRSKSLAERLEDEVRREREMPAMLRAASLIELAEEAARELRLLATKEG